MIILSDGHDRVAWGCKNKVKYPFMREHTEVVRLNNLVANLLTTGGIEVLRINADWMLATDLAGRTGGLPNSLLWKVRAINAICDKEKVEAAFEMHLNAMPQANTASGHEVLYTSDAGKMLAAELDKFLDAQWPSKDRNTRDEDGLYFLDKVRAPATIIEPFFLDSDTDTDLYLARPGDLARALADGIAAGLNRLGKP